MGTLRLFGLAETHMPTLVRRHRKKMGCEDAGQRLETDRPEGILRTLGRAVSLPARIASHAPIALILLLICILNGLVNMILSSLGSVYQNVYAVPERTCGLAYLGIGLGGLT